MSNKTNKRNLFTRVYKRASKSPFDDHGTILWLACLVSNNKEGLNLTYERYIYLHREANGTICGISVSKQILDENPEFEDLRYMEGIPMYAFLLLHVEEISAFCELFRDEFIDVFLVPPLDYFAIAEKYWLEKISDA